MNEQPNQTEAANGQSHLTDLLGHATRYALQLAVSLHKKHYPEVDQWEPLPDLMGLLTQIDNMTCGLSRDRIKELEALP